MGIFDTVTTLARAYHPSPQHIRLSITLTLVAFALANIITLFRALRSSDSFSAVLTNPWPSATFIDIFAGFVLSIPYLIAHSPHGLPLSLPTLFLLPSIPLLYSTAFLPTFLPFAPGTALSPSRPHVLALRYTATATLAITTIAFLNAWIRQSPGVGWDVVEGNKWAGAVFVADLCGMLFTGLYVGKREEWRWRVVVPAWIAVFVFGNSFAVSFGEVWLRTPLTSPCPDFQRLSFSVVVRLRDPLYVWHNVHPRSLADKQTYPWGAMALREFHGAAGGGRCAARPLRTAGRWARCVIETCRQNTRGKMTFAGILARDRCVNLLHRVHPRSAPIHIQFT
ncbi:hypothetical protein DFJ77DRAFT_455327 [Powellomyces hirtus]|nr:hypothetical protein DFJ77DRAFT_455327 [Powellomyces hirtus]